MATKGFASTTDMAEKKVTFSEIGTDLYAFTAEGDPNTAIIVGDDGCLVFDAQSTPAMANKVIERVRTVTDKPIKYVVLSHYHAVRVLGASAYKAEAIIASDETRRLIEEREPVYQRADITIWSRDVPHEKIVDECIEALHALLCGGATNEASNSLSASP